MLLFQGYSMQSGLHQARCWAGIAAHHGKVNDLLSSFLVVGFNVLHMRTKIQCDEKFWIFFRTRQGPTRIIVLTAALMLPTQTSALAARRHKRANRWSQ